MSPVSAVFHSEYWTQKRTQSKSIHSVKRTKKDYEKDPNNEPKTNLPSVLFTGPYKQGFHFTLKHVLLPDPLFMAQCSIFLFL